MNNTETTQSPAEMILLQHCAVGKTSIDVHLTEIDDRPQSPTYPTPDLNDDSITECVICFEEIGKTNSCVTPCGHKFCFNCMVKALKKKDTCPMCRTALQEESEEESDSDSDSNTEFSSYFGDEIWNGNGNGYDSEHEFINITTNSNYTTPNVIEEKIIEKGYTMEDIIVLWTGRIDRLNPRYNQRFIKKLEMDLEKIIAISDREQSILTREINRMSNEDIRTKEQNNMDIFERFPSIDLTRLFSALE